MVNIFSYLQKVCLNLGNLESAFNFRSTLSRSSLSTEYLRVVSLLQNVIMQKLEYNSIKDLSREMNDLAKSVQK
jgi:hypothetical protein